MKRRRGYVLLVTLGLLVMASTLLVAVGRVAVRHSTDARLAVQASQRRWAFESARTAVLPYAAQALATAEENERRPAPRVRADVRLGDLAVTLVIADEQAKANVNELLRREPLETAENRIRVALDGTLSRAHVRLRPAPAYLTQATPEIPPAMHLPPVSGFGQILDDLSPGMLRPSTGDGPTDRLTVWGDGGLNLLRADRSAMRAVLMPTFTALQVERIVAAREAAFNPRRESSPLKPMPQTGDAVAMLLERAGAAEAPRAKLALTARSTCHSLTVRLRDGRREWYDTHVLDEADPRRPRRYGGAW